MKKAELHPLCIDGTLEIDRQKGIIYFHDKNLMIRLEIKKVPKNIEIKCISITLVF
jgi:hypothetical protein